MFVSQQNYNVWGFWGGPGPGLTTQVRRHKLECTSFSRASLVTVDLVVEPEDTVLRVKEMLLEMLQVSDKWTLRKTSVRGNCPFSS